MRLSEDEKIELWREIEEKFNNFSLRTSMKPDYKITVIPKDEKKSAIQSITKNKDTEYDIRVNLPTGRLFIKIFKYARNFNSSEAIANRYGTYILSARPIIESIAKRGDLWLLLVKTPKGWNYLIHPIIEEQRGLIEHLLQRARRQKHKTEDDLSELQLFMIFWIKRDIDTPLYGLLRYGFHH